MIPFILILGMLVLDNLHLLRVVLAKKGNRAPRVRRFRSIAQNILAMEPRGPERSTGARRTNARRPARL